MLPHVFPIVQRKSAAKGVPLHWTSNVPVAAPVTVATCCPFTTSGPSASTLHPAGTFAAAPTRHEYVSAPGPLATTVRAPDPFRHAWAATGSCVITGGIEARRQRVQFAAGTPLACENAPPIHNSGGSGPSPSRSTDAKAWTYQPFGSLAFGKRFRMPGEGSTHVSFARRAKRLVLKFPPRPSTSCGAAGPAPSGSKVSGVHTICPTGCALPG